MAFQNLWDIAKAVLKRKYTVIVSIKKGKKIFK